jgi:hypothetical protein
VSLGVAIKGAEGVVLAADSRVTLEASRPAPQPPIIVTFDNATKLLSFEGEKHKWVGAVTYGAAVIGARTAHSFFPEFELKLPGERLPVAEYAKLLSEFFMERWKEVMQAGYQGPDMTFLIGGFDEGAAYGSVYILDIPRNPTPQPRTAGDHDFGMTWGGQFEVASRIVHGFEPSLPGLIQQALDLSGEQMQKLMPVLGQLEFRFPYQVLPLQDCIDLATFMIRTTVTAQSLSVGIRGVGGPIDVATITRVNGLEFIQRKKIRGETEGGAK